MWLILLLTLFSAIFLLVVVLIAAGLYKDPVLRQFERYAEFDDSFHLLPLFLLGMGLFALFGGVLFAAAVAPRYPSVVLGVIFLVLAYFAREQRARMNAYPEVFMAFPRWYADLRQRTTREERRRIAYMWLCLPRSMRLHLNGSDRHFMVWADLVILATVTQTVEDQEATVERAHYLPDTYGRFG
ncbi:MAG: hypothetical protein IT319_02330 [Anaerolineae bacterium]|nr:hypothetical protein [Anaerolineae bacterium]